MTSRARGIETADLGRMPEIGRSIFEFGASQRRIEGRSPETSAAFPHPDRIGHTRCELDHRAMCSSILGCRHVPDSGEEDVSSFGSSGAEHFDGMAQECVRWLPGCIGPRVVADPGSVTTVTRLRIRDFGYCSTAGRNAARAMVGIDHHANQLAHSRQFFDASPRGRCRLEAAVVGWMESGNDVRAIPA